MNNYSTYISDNEIFHYIDEMKEVHSGFDYRISRDKMTNEITGVAWITSVMQASLQKIGGYIVLDAMKHEL